MCVDCVPNIRSFCAGAKPIHSHVWVEAEEVPTMWVEEEEVPTVCSTKGLAHEEGSGKGRQSEVLEL